MRLRISTEALGEDGSPLHGTTPRAGAQSFLQALSRQSLSAHSMGAAGAATGVGAGKACGGVNERLTTGAETDWRHSGKAASAASMMVTANATPSTPNARASLTRV